MAIDKWRCYLQRKPFVKNRSQKFVSPSGPNSNH
uniref:Uncharacterized protein n=1 Tax=Arundo donax TaxID=35708 RepID=A0A0A9AG17_ARUDO